LFSFSELSGLVSEEIRISFKTVTINYLELHSPDYAFNLYGRMRAFVSAVHADDPVSCITPELVLRYRATLTPDTEWYLGALRVLFYRWIDLGLPGVAAEAGPLLRRMRLRSNQKGVAVLTSDPDKGPLTEVEFQALAAALNDLFAKGVIGVGDYLLVWLFLAIGARPVQIAMLKASDLSVARASDGTTAHILQVPRAKQRGAGPRSASRPRKLIPDIGLLMEQYLAGQRERWRYLGIAAEEMPLFVNPNNTASVPGLAYHRTGKELSRRMGDVFALLDVRSERTGRRLTASPRRLRYTRGTRAAMEGASELVIAELLDHSDTQSVGIYVEAVPEIVQRIDRTMAMQLAPLAQAFTGQLIDTEGEAVRGDDPTSRIVSPHQVTQPVGSCGSFGFCGALAPVACYTCRNFQPWLGGPHEEVLDDLLVERARVLEETGDARIAAVNDRTIYACAEVVRRCAERLGRQGSR
jgi:integrase